MVNPLEKYTEDQLRAEIRRREEEAAERARRERQLRLETFSELIDFPVVQRFVRLILPQHSRTTCSEDDEDVVNDGRCMRCTVLQAMAVHDVEKLSEMRLTEVWS